MSKQLNVFCKVFYELMEELEMKRMFAVLLAALLLLSLAACGKEESADFRRGIIEQGNVSVQLRKHYAEFHTVNTDIELSIYDNLSTALLDLKNGKINQLACEESTTKYIMARNEGLDYQRKNDWMNFSMMTLDTKLEVYDILNNAILEMKSDGTLDALVETELKAYFESDPEAKELPVFENAQTIYIGVTGDIPPMDFVASNGKAAGFNVALLTEIANRAQVNFEMVQIESGARAIALSSGKVDAVFWTKSGTCAACNETWSEEIPGTLVTESYFSDYVAMLQSKSAK